VHPSALFVKLKMANWLLLLKKEEENQKEENIRGSILFLMKEEGVSCVFC